MSILDITEKLDNDVSIEEYEYSEYLPIVGDVNKLNNTGDIGINIETQDIFMHPSESYLLTESKLIKGPDGGRYSVDDSVTLTNNGLMYLFSSIRYELSGKEIERINHPGWATTMLGLLKYSDDFSKSRGLNQLWYKDTSTAASTEGVNINTGFKFRKTYIIDSIVDDDKKGAFSFKVPLKHIFRFCEDYHKIVYGMKHTLYLTRTGNNDAIFKRARAVGPPVLHEVGKVELEKIAWYMPHVLPADQYKLQLYKLINDKLTFPVIYRMIQCDTASVPQAKSFTWRLAVKTSPEFPHYIIVGFQTDKQNAQLQNPAIFDNVDVNEIHVTLNSQKYPKTDYKLSFPENKFSRAYGDVAAFRSKFFLMEDIASNPNFTPLEYKNLYPLFLFDVSKQSERLKYSVTDIHIKAIFGGDANIPANTHAYAIIISGRQINFQSDGNKMSVVY